MRGITKSFGGVPVLKEVDFDLRKGEIHALAGGNGAGKSTLMKILVGVYTRDGGAYEVDGAKVDFRTVQDARAAGVGMIFQEFSLIPTLSVAQNVFLTRETRTVGGLIDDREMERRTRDLFAEMSETIRPPPTTRRVAHGVLAADRDRQGVLPGRPGPDHGRADCSPCRLRPSSCSR